MIIRREHAGEFPRVHELVRAAFETAKVSNGREQDFVTRLRGGDNYIPELALVAEDAGCLIGHVMLTKTVIATGDGPVGTLLLAPVSVVLAHRNRGVGSALIRDGFRLARDMGHASVILVGDPAYYTRFGFRPSVDFGIRNAQEIPDQYVLACELLPGALRGITGTITFETE